MRPPPVARETTSLDEILNVFSRGDVEGEVEDCWTDIAKRAKVELAALKAARQIAPSGEEKRVDELLNKIHHHDRSREYEYGEALRNGSKPGPGQRFLTPRELVDVYRREAAAQSIPTRAPKETKQCD